MKPFKNAVIYRLTRDAINLENMQEQLESCAFKPCGSQDKISMGWVPPMGSGFDNLIHIANGQALITAQTEEKILPSNVIKKHLDAKIEKLESEQQRKLKKAEKDSLKDEVIHTLLPRAFSRESQVRIWLHPAKSLVVVDAASAKRAEDALALLRKGIGSLPIVPLSMQTPPEVTMTEWVRSGSVGNGFTLLDEVELKAVLEAGGTVRCKKQDLVSDEVSTHIDAGKRVTSVGLDWQERIQFSLTEQSLLKRIKLTDTLLEQNDDISREEPEARFDADFVLLTGELDLLIDSLITALGGELGS
ncbi:recombination-associated protein RdgC [Rosenbergiella nectarea]|uniref:recombination-associated protein RdgC n=1 Tax=Rosenbergiella nectarea TaxID=988801 RepID=UPI001F4D7856|nr:recombination-associated protein RdgC [Rosenbergiella nectarea]